MSRIIKNITTSKLLNAITDLKDSSIGTILTLHRVSGIDPSKISYNEHLKISPFFLEKIILKFRKNGFSFISIDEFHDILIKGKRAKKILVFTLDDGYKDNYSNAFPIFKTYSVPFTIYIATALPQREMIYWWYTLEDLILNNNSITLSNGRSFQCSNKHEKERTFLEIREEIIYQNTLRYNTVLPQLFANNHFDLKKYNDTLPLSWDLVKQLSKEPLVTIGAHTHSHLAMKHCKPEEIKSDIKKSNDLFIEHIGAVPKHFCYPFGDSHTLSENEISLIKTMGYKTAVTTTSGNIYNKHSGLLHQLPRIFVSESSEDKLFKDIKYMKFRNR